MASHIDSIIDLNKKAHRWSSHIKQVLNVEDITDIHTCFYHIHLPTQEFFFKEKPFTVPEQNYTIEVVEAKFTINNSTLTLTIVYKDTSLDSEILDFKSNPLRTIYFEYNLPDSVSEDDVTLPVGHVPLEICKEDTILKYTLQGIMLW